MIAKIKEILSAKNFMGVKISAGVLGAVAIVSTCIVLTGKEEPTNVNSTTHKGETTEIVSGDIAQNITTSYIEETSNEVTTDLTTEQIMQNLSTEESLEVIIPVEGNSSAMETTRKSISASESTTTQVSTTIQSNKKIQNMTTTEVQTTTVPQTTKKQTTGNITTTQAPTMTQAPTTTKPEATTEEETTKPRRAANGVILEQLTMYFREYTQCTVPGSWAQIMEEEKNPNLYGLLVAAVDVPKYAEPNAFHNELRIYNSADGTGSTPEEVLKIYGAPLVLNEGEEDGEEYSIFYYRYLDWDVSEDDRMYVCFRFFTMEYEDEMTDKLLYDVTFGPYEHFAEYMEE